MRASTCPRHHTSPVVCSSSDSPLLRVITYHGKGKPDIRHALHEWRKRVKIARQTGRISKVGAGAQSRADQHSAGGAASGVVREISRQGSELQ